MTSGEGPTNVMPSRRQSCANSAFSDTKPQPGQTASARARAQRALQLGQVQVRAGGAEGLVRVVRADQHGLVGLPDEHGVPVDRGVQRDRLQRGPALGVPLADRVDQPHGRLAAVDDGHPGQRGRPGHRAQSPKATRTSSLVVGSRLAARRGRRRRGRGRAPGRRSRGRPAAPRSRRPRRPRSPARRPGSGAR